MLGGLVLCLRKLHKVLFGLDNKKKNKDHLCNILSLRGVSCHLSKIYPRVEIATFEIPKDLDL